MNRNIRFRGQSSNVDRLMALIGMVIAGLLVGCTVLALAWLFQTLWMAVFG